jgi:hypothetical protein
MLEADPASSYVQDLAERYDRDPGHASDVAPYDPNSYESAPYDSAQYESAPYGSGQYESAPHGAPAPFPPAPFPPAAYPSGPAVTATAPQPAAFEQSAAFEQPAAFEHPAAFGQPAAFAAVAPPSAHEPSASAGRTARAETRARRSARGKRSPLRRMGMVYPVTAIAVVVVVGVALAAYLFAPVSSGKGGAAAFEAITNSTALTALEQERQQIIDMNAAAQTLSVTGNPKVVSPTQVVASAQASANAASSSSSTSSSSSSSSSSNSTPTEPTGPTPDPGSAEAIGYAELPAFGYSQTTQWGCLYNLWMRESGWVYDAENPSGAYGIPQALPASKMASAGSDYLTDPKTQIIWGLGYIKSTYSTPCGAWNFEEANGYY